MSATVRYRSSFTRSQHSFQRPNTQSRRIAVHADISEGDKVKITTDMKVFHVPGFKKGLSIEDMEGEVKANITEFKGVELSPNYPWKIQLAVEQENGRTRKFFVHLDEDEFEKI